MRFFSRFAPSEGQVRGLSRRPPGFYFSFLISQFSVLSSQFSVFGFRFSVNTISGWARPIFPLPWWEGVRGRGQPCRVGTAHHSRRGDPLGRPSILVPKLHLGTPRFSFPSCTWERPFPPKLCLGTSGFQPVLLRQGGRQGNRGLPVARRLACANCGFGSRRL